MYAPGLCVTRTTELPMSNNRKQQQKARQKAKQRAKKRARTGSQDQRSVSLDDLRRRCELARLDARALYKTIDRFLPGVGMSPDLYEHAELDADLAEALRVMGKPLGRVNVPAMVRDTEASLRRLASTRESIFASLGTRQREIVSANIAMVRASLFHDEAYLDIPGRDPFEEARPIHFDAEIRQALSRLPRTEEVWVCARERLKTYVEEPKPYRPDVTVWFREGTGDLVGGRVSRPEQGDAVILDTLAQSMLEPMTGVPRRPSLVRLREARVACSVQDALVDIGMAAASAHGEEDATLEAMAKLLSGTPFGAELGGAIRERDWGGIPDGVVASFYHATAAAYRAVPWPEALAENAVKVDLDRWGWDDLCLVVRPDKSLTAFASVDDFVSFSIALSMWNPRAGKPAPAAMMLAVRFVGGDEISAAERKEIMSKGWEVAAPDAYPVLHKLDADGTIAPVTSEDCRTAAAYAQAIAVIAAESPHVLTRRDPLETTTQVPFPGMPDVVIRAIAPHPDLRG